MKKSCCAKYLSRSAHPSIQAAVHHSHHLRLLRHLLLFTELSAACLGVQVLVPVIVSPLPTPHATHAAGLEIDSPLNSPLHCSVCNYERRYEEKNLVS